MVFLNIRSDRFFLYRICMRIMGVWPLDHHKYYAVIIFWVTTSLQVVFLIVRLVDPLGNCPAHEFGSIDFLLTVQRIFLISLQLSSQLSWRQKISLIKSTNHDWSSVVDPGEREIMIQHDNWGSWIFIFRATVIALTVVRQFLELPFISLVTSENMRDTCAFADHFTWGTVNATLEYVTFAMGYIMSLAMKALFWTFVMHLSAQYKILKERYDDLRLIANNEERRGVFRRLVQRHNELIDRTRDLKNSLHNYVTVYVVIEQLYICIYASALIVNIRVFHYAITIHNVLFIAMYLLNLYVSYFACEYLTTSCKDVGEAFTQCNWYDQPKEFMINYSIVILRCETPLEFKVLGLYKLDLNNFKHVIEALHSYISLMLVVR